MTIKEIKNKSANLFKNAKQRVKDALSAKNHDEDDEIGRGTKVKVLAAIVVVGFATYIAYWVQEPIAGYDIQANVVGQEDVSEENPVADTAKIAIETSEGAIEVSIEDFSYIPANLTVNPGTVVVWTNKDPVPHTVTSEQFGSGTLGPGESFSYTFRNDGTYNYDCSFHPQMKGKIIVGTGVSSGEAELPLSPVEAFEEEMMAPSAGTETDISAELLTLADPPELVTRDNVQIGALERVEDEAMPESVTLDAQQLLEEDILAESPVGEAHAAISEADELAKSGPEDILYLGMIGIILYFNRRRLSGFKF